MAYGVIKTSFDSSRETWDEAKAKEFAYIITSGLAAGTFFVQGKVYEDKEDAKNESYEVREWAAYDRSRARYGYASWRDRIWVHEVEKIPGKCAVYLPSIGEIKKGMEYIHANVMGDNPSRDYIDWEVAHDKMTPKQIREELLAQYYA